MDEGAGRRQTAPVPIPHRRRLMIKVAFTAEQAAVRAAEP
jgi:hypothetical protein